MRGSSLVAASLAAALVFPACGGRDCTAVADDLIGALQDTLDAAADLTPADLEAPDGELPEFLQDVEQRGEELQTEADELGCDEDQMRQLVADRIDQLEAESGTVAEVLLQFLTNQDFFDDIDG